jgi:putative molybdopterin biosynthesis protein
MSEEMLNTKEVARYLGIHEKQVYALIKSKKIPCTRVTGKWIFPKKMIDEWIESHSREGIIQAREKSSKIKGALLAAGSNDPILDILLTYMKKNHPEFYIFTANTGSTEGLTTIGKGYTDIAWTHLLDPKSGEYNIPFIAQHLSDMRVVVVNLFYRELGLVISPDNPHNIKGFEDLSKEGIRLINRQKGSGTRILLDYNLEKAGISPEAIGGYSEEVFTHFEVGLAVLSGEADVGIATIAVSKLFGLSFLPITKESFDMVLSQETFFAKGVQYFIESLGSKEFRKKVEALGNYDFKDSGKILHTT